LERNAEPFLHVPIKEKWTKYFVSVEEIKVIQSIRDDKRFTKFSDLALINLGITTGNNTYFSVNKTTNERYNLSSVTLPLIGRSSHAHGIYFTDIDWQENIQDNKKAMLISFPDTPYEAYPAKHKEYIELLERIDSIVRNDEDIEKALDLVDQKLLVEVLGIDKNICTSCRQIWKKMQMRRLGRG